MSFLPGHACPGQFRKPGAPPREEILDEVYEDELDLQRSGSYLNSSIASAWSERSLDPGDIRVGAALLTSSRCYLGTGQQAVMPCHSCCVPLQAPCPLPSSSSKTCLPFFSTIAPSCFSCFYTKETTHVKRSPQIPKLTFLRPSWQGRGRTMSGAQISCVLHSTGPP